MNTKIVAQRVLELTAQYGIPSWGLIIYWNQAEVFRMVGGQSDYERRTPAAASDVYWIYSLTKLATCTAAMQLIERGRLRLDDLVADYLPAFARPHVMAHGGLRPARTPLRVLDLLTMRGGLDYDTSNLVGRHGAEATNEALINAIADKPLCFDPGARFQYSLCHDVLAGVIASSSGVSFESWLENEIFKPLGMTETHFDARAGKRRPFSAQYQYENGAIRPNDMQNIHIFSPEYRSGGAGLASTLTDYILLINALANGGLGASGNRVLLEDSVRSMATNRLTPEQLRDFGQWRPGYGYGLGVRTRLVDGGRLPADFGWDGAAGSYALADLDHRLALLYLQHVRNCSPAYDVIHPALRDAAYEALS